MTGFLIMMEKNITPTNKNIPENNQVPLIPKLLAIKPLIIKPTKAPNLLNIDSSDKTVALFLDSIRLFM